MPLFLPTYLREDGVVCEHDKRLGKISTALLMSSLFAEINVQGSWTHGTKMKKTGTTTAGAQTRRDVLIVFCAYERTRPCPLTQSVASAGDMRFHVVSDTRRPLSR